MTQKLHYIISVGILAVLSTGCSREVKPESNDPEITFTLQLAPELESKAAGLYTSDNLNTIGSFMTTGYDEDGTSKKVNNQKVIYSGGEWKLESNPKMWEEGKTMTFWADANMPSYASTTTSSAASISLSISEIPTTVSSQWDPLIGYYNGNGNGEGKANITFYHPLTAVQFKAGDMSSYSSYMSGINSVTLKGVYKTGTVNITHSSSIAYNWGSTRTGSLNMTVAFNTEKKQSVQPCILIPQTFAAGTILLDIEIALVAGGTQSFSNIQVPAGEWKAGYINTYTLDLNGPQMEPTLNVTLTDWTKIMNGDKEWYNANFDQ